MKISAGGTFLLGALLVLGLFATAGTAQAASTQFTCTNPKSGTTFKLAVDFAVKTAGVVPSIGAATINDSEIDWQDPADGGLYSLNRSSGLLTVAYASSVGGFFLHDNCRQG
jgi:hypothetical protein